MVGKLRDKISAVAKSALAFAGVTLGLQQAVQAAGDFEEQPGKIAAKGGYTTAQMAELAAGIERIATESGVTGTEAARGMEVLAKGAKITTSSAASLAKALSEAGGMAKATGLDLEQTVAALDLLHKKGIKGGSRHRAGRDPHPTAQPRQRRQRTINRPGHRPPATRRTAGVASLRTCDAVRA